MLLYRKTRQRVGKLLTELQESGYNSVRIEVSDQGPDDILDICRLTCLEHGVETLVESDPGETPVLEVSGSKVYLHFPKQTMKLTCEMRGESNDRFLEG